MKPLYKVIIVLVAAILLVAALGSAFNQIAVSPILTKKLNTQDGDQDVPVKETPDLNTDPLQHHSQPDLNTTILPPELNTTIPNKVNSSNETDQAVNGTIFIDKNGNGKPDPGEAQSDVGVELFDQNGTLIATTQTDKNGSYSFTGIAPGQYNVSTVPGMNGNVTGYQNQTIYVNDGGLPNIDLNSTSKPTQNPTVATITTILQSQDTAKKGVLFRVSGTVMTVHAKPVSGIPVMVYVAANKTTAKRYFIGSGVVQNGNYDAVCMIPNDLVLGNYQLIASSLGNGTYLSSESDPSVTVTDESKILIDAPARMIMESYMHLAVTLKENSSSKPVVGAEVTFSVRTAQGELFGGPGWTDADGMYVSDWFMMNPGTYNVSVSFGGNSYLNGTSANQTVTVLDVTVDVAPDYLIRGYDNKVFALVHASELPVANRSIVASLDDSVIGLYFTNMDGRCNITVPVQYYHALGQSKMIFSVASVKKYEVNVSIMSMTTMMVYLKGNQVNATLLDDHNQVMLHYPIQLKKSDNTSVDTKLSQIGSEFSLSTNERADYVVQFNGTMIYQPSFAVVHYTPSGSGPSWDWLIFGAPLALALSLLVAFMVHRSRKGALHLTQALPPSAPLLAQVQTSPYSIMFPQIGEDLPRVWEDEPLLFHIVGEKGDMRLDIDGTTSMVTLDSGSGSFNVKLPKGEHVLSVSGPLGTTVVPVRVVDYREETVSLYRSTFDSWKTHGNGISDSMTPRELQSVIEPRLDRSLHGQLDVMISLFEIAEFSQRPIGRPEYESMFRASDKVR